MLLYGLILGGKIDTYRRGNLELTNFYGIPNSMPGNVFPIPNNEIRYTGKIIEEKVVYYLKISATVSISHQEQALSHKNSKYDWDFL